MPIHIWNQWFPFKWDFKLHQTHNTRSETCLTIHWYFKEPFCSIITCPKYMGKQWYYSIQHRVLTFLYRPIFVTRSRPVMDGSRLLSFSSFFDLTLFSKWHCEFIIHSKDLMVSISCMTWLWLTPSPFTVGLSFSSFLSDIVTKLSFSVNDLKHFQYYMIQSNFHFTFPYHIIW